MRRLSGLLASLLTLCLVASGCSGSSNGGDQDGPVQYATNGTFTMAIKDGPAAFDPYHPPSIGIYAGLAYDSLVNLQPDGKFVSGLAEEWTADAHSATFVLRPDVTCSDGTPLVATHVAEAINYVSDPANASSQYGLRTPTVPLTATGDDTTRTVNIALEEPFGFLLHTIGQLPIVCPRGLKNPDVLKTSSDGTGPFVLTDIVPGQSLTFTKREDYVWGPGGATTREPGTPAKVVLRTIPNETTAANLLLGGEVNFALIGSQNRQRLDARGMDYVETASSGAWLWFNHLDGHTTADARVRRALVHALDLEEVVAVSTGGTGDASTGLVAMEPKACAGNTVDGQLPEYDVEAAEALLDQAGWVTGDDGIRRKDGQPLTLDLHYDEVLSPLEEPTAVLLADQWRAIGVDVELSGDSATSFTQVMFETSNYDVYMVGFGFSLPSQAQPYFSGPAPPDGTNLAGIHNADYENLVTKARALTPPEACNYWNQAEQALFRDVNVVPISDRPLVYYLQNAEAQITGSSFPVPTSIRVHK